MLIVKPVNNKLFQNELCDLCNVKFIENSLAYYAAEWSISEDKLDYYIGICQFTIFNDTGRIINLREKENVKDDEAMIIMLRACLSFMYRSGLKNAYIEASENNINVINTLKIPCVNGGFQVDLEKLFNRSCEN